MIKLEIFCFCGCRLSIDIIRRIFIHIFKISLGVFTSIICFSYDLLSRLHQHLVAFEQLVHFLSFRKGQFPCAYTGLGRKRCVKYCVKSASIQSYSAPYSVRMRENADQNNSECEHFSRSEERYFFLQNINKTFLITFKKAIAVGYQFPSENLIIKLMLSTLFRYTEYGKVRVVHKNSINCFILVILRNIRDFSLK